MQRRLYRSQDDRPLTGVAGGMADYFDVDPTIMRLLWVLLAIFTGGVAVLAYVVMAVVVPVAPASAPGIEPGAVGGDDASADAGDPDDETEESEGAPHQQSASTTPDAARTYRPYESGQPADGRSRAMGGPAFIGLALVVIGILALLDSLGLFAHFDSWRLWPLVLIAFGAFLVLRRR